MEENSLFYCSSKDVSPMMSQYLNIKGKYPGCLLFFRMGDFYEMFFDDAKIASSVLNIALTTRGKHMDSDIPMCGVPVVSMDSYIGRLVKYGYKVAICDQMEDPKEAKKRGYKAVVRREVTRILTAGTLVDDSLLSANKNNFLMAVVPDICKKSANVKTISFATIDISTGDFFVNTVVVDEFSSVLEIYKPRELLIPSVHENSDFSRFISANSGAAVTFLPDSKFNPAMEKERLEKYFNVKTLDSFGISLPNELSSCGAVLEYLLITQRDNLSTLPIPKKTIMSDYLVIDPATSKSMEITVSSRGEYIHSLLGVLNKTSTPFGARALAARVSMPIIDQNRIRNRLDCVEFFIINGKISKIIRETMSRCPDFERVLNRIKFNKFSPRDLGDVRESLRILIGVQDLLKNTNLPSEGEYTLEKLRNFSDLLKLLETALLEKLPMATREGVIADGYSKKLDELKYIKNHSEDLIAQLQTKYITETSVNTLRIKDNAIIGWYVEIPASQKQKLGSNFVHRQTLVNAVRYTTEELMAMEAKLVEAFEEWNKVEREIYLEIVEEVMRFYEELLYAIKFLSCIDIYTNFAAIAIERKYVRPEIILDPVLYLKNGRHPVLEIYAENFSSNDCDINLSDRVLLLTGPNMAGKSTYLRQNALIIIMAQIGCYVPATAAKIGIVDRLFSRIGASDDIIHGRSTFMTEMIETATILHQATERSFVILDEVGRGTSTYDGLSIAWAVVENLFRINKCRVLFATHYRELTALQHSIPNVCCKTMKVQEWNNEVIFHHKVIDGIADKSYGIHVAGLAGVPKSVIKRAQELLKKFESEENKRHGSNFEKTAFNQMELLCESNRCESCALHEQILEVDLNNITPKMAMDILYRLKEKCK
ncbi:MAG: DNA mismatch repair protein MutS [Holosporaceae bacterium]|jgi:DNA mismatch repair protein MutS|nr:DNA mismatch repair protein MutS [Holosporaceae bacterium]